MGACGGGQGEAQAPDTSVAAEMAAGRAAAQGSAAQSARAAEAEQRARRQAQGQARQQAGGGAGSTQASPAGESSALLDLVPAGTPRLALLRVAEALQQPLFDELVSELGEVPRVAEQSSADWALQCLTMMRPEFSAMEVGGRPARRMGPFVVVDAGNDRLLVARQGKRCPRSSGSRRRRHRHRHR